MSVSGGLVVNTTRRPAVAGAGAGAAAGAAAVGPHVEGPRCAAIDLNYDPIISVICAMYIVFGIVYTFFGYRCFKASMFLTGFTFATAIVYLICLQEYLMPPYGNLVVSVCAGILFGLITMLIQYVGLFITGFHTGLLLAIQGLAVYDHFLYAAPPNYWVVVVTLLCTGIFFAVINLYWKRVLTIVGTSVYGGVVIAACLDYYIDRLQMMRWVWARAWLEVWSWPECARGWWALGAGGAAAVLGALLQARSPLTHHRASLAARKLRLARPTPDQRNEMKQRNYRYLYQVRTAHGDVISQSYVQALQKKASCSNWSGECSTLQSDSTRLSALPPPDSDEELAHH